jgi:hypothetical protein
MEAEEVRARTRVLLNSAARAVVESAAMAENSRSMAAEARAVVRDVKEVTSRALVRAAEHGR